MDGFEIIDKRFVRFVLPNAPLEKLADGFRWLEGPVWFANPPVFPTARRATARAV